ncbi:MAG: hypothetical protein OEW87_12770, partial [Flavobacteriaceae bacterium]|nr:hypothetical protein [Flavobacteriaceae bacterium]
MDAVQLGFNHIYKRGFMINLRFLLVIGLCLNISVAQAASQCSGKFKQGSDALTEGVNYFISAENAFNEG